MYRCDVCDSVVALNTPCINIVVETRPREYPRRPDAHWQPPRDGGKGKWVDDPGGSGTEIARELRVCAACADQLAYPSDSTKRATASAKGSG